MIGGWFSPNSTVIHRVINTKMILKISICKFWQYHRSIEFDSFWSAFFFLTLFKNVHEFFGMLFFSKNINSNTKVFKIFVTAFKTYHFDSPIFVFALKRIHFYKTVCAYSFCFLCLSFFCCVDFECTLNVYFLL